MKKDTGTLVAQDQPKHVRIQVAGRDVNLLVYPNGTKPAELINVNASATKEEVIAGIEVYPSAIDPHRIVVRWPHDPSLRYALIIMDSTGGNTLYQGTPTNADRTSVPIADMENYVGKRVYAVLICVNSETGEPGIGLDKWFILPRAGARGVHNYHEPTGKWVYRRKWNRFRILETTLLFLLYTAVLRAAYYIAFEYR